MNLTTPLHPPISVVRLLSIVYGVYRNCLGLWNYWSSGWRQYWHQRDKRVDERLGRYGDVERNDDLGF